MKKEKQKFWGIRRILFLTLAAMFLSLSGFTQNAVSGTIASADGEPIPGATIVLKGTSTGTVSDVDGKFSINAANGDILVISFVGMKSTEVTVSGQTAINVVMEQDVIGLEEIVATGYGTAKKKDLTGAAVSADIEAFRESPNVNIMQSLQGSVPGVQIGQVNQAGEEPVISIRGQTTIDGNKNPLIVVDGIIYRGRIGDLNPSDIKSVDILKDASSKAIYGAQAANGVIIITTQGGKTAQKPVIQLTSSISSQTPTVKTRLLDRDAWMQKVKDVNYNKAYLAPDYTQPNPDWDYSQSELTPPNLTGIENGTEYDWWDAMTDPGFIFNNLLSISGGSDNTTYYLSGGYTGQEGFIMNDDYRRSTLRMNIKTDITNWLTIGANTFGSFTDQSGSYPDVAGIANTSPVINPKDENGDYVINHFGDNVVNPFLNAQADDKDISNNISANLFTILKIPGIKGLTYQLNYSTNLRWWSHFYSNEYGAGITGNAYKSHSENKDVMLDNIFNYERQFGDHELKATLVAGYNKVQYYNTLASGENIPNLSLSYNSLEQSIIQAISSDAWEESSIYQMGRLNYNFKNKYLATATLRRDGFSGFAKNNKIAFFPSFGVGWVLTEEDFFNIPKIDYLKLRASYGENGNQTSRYSSLARISAEEGSKYVYGDGSQTSIGQSVASLSNNDLSWESTVGFNFGIDFGFFDNILRGNMEYYSSTTNNLLWNMVLPQTTGFNQIKTNLGEIANSGFEFSVEADIIKTNDFMWNINLNFATNKNEIVTLLGDDNDEDGIEDDLIASGLFIGESIGTIYDYEIDGIWQIGDEVPTGFTPGTYRVIDQQAADGGEYSVTAADDRIILGKTEPAYRFGIQNTFTYKDFSLRFFINSIQGGNDGYLGRNHTDGVSGTSGTFQNSNIYDMYDYWSPTNPNGRYPQAWMPAQIRPVRYDSRSFVRLQDISLAYTLNKPVTDKLGIAGLKLYVSGKNLLTLTEWEGWDPETGQGIGNNDAFPLMKAYTFGMDISF